MAKEKRERRWLVPNKRANNTVIEKQVLNSSFLNKIKGLSLVNALY